MFYTSAPAGRRTTVAPIRRQTTQPLALFPLPRRWVIRRRTTTPYVFKRRPPRPQPTHSAVVIAQTCSMFCARVHVLTGYLRSPGDRFERVAFNTWRAGISKSPRLTRRHCSRARTGTGPCSHDALKYYRNLLYYKTARFSPETNVQVTSVHLPAGRYRLQGLAPPPPPPCLV